MKFLADVNVSRRVVEQLQVAGFEAIRVTDIMDGRSPDQEILSEARSRRAVLISHDQDFSAILAISGASAPSLINLRTSSVETEQLVRAIVTVVRATEEELRAGAVVTVYDAGVRVHRLPLT
jgi:predicted nuclease of predicted toxin-antitoxin system